MVALNQRDRKKKRRIATTPFNESRDCIEAKRQERSRYVKNILAKRERKSRNKRLLRIV